MPIIRLDNEGNDIESLEAKAKRKKNAFAAILVSSVGLTASVITFFAHSEQLAILLSVWCVGLLAGLNLIDD